MAIRTVIYGLNVRFEPRYQVKSAISSLQCVIGVAATEILDYDRGMGKNATWRLCVVLAAFAVLGLSGCQKIKKAAGMSGGQAFLNSQIPPGLAPQYFPPQGFVWGSYRAGTLPEARYGVASPPVNPRAQVMILADADYPAEAYFELTRQLLDQGYGVWLLEVPGQGGAGRYIMQGNSIYSPNFRDAETAANGFIRDIIHPTPDKPLFIVGTGYSALSALSLGTVLKDDSIPGFIAFDPYTGGPISKGGEWHREDVPNSHWGEIAQAWQTSNPDLRLRIKSEAWQNQVKKAFTDLNGLHLPVMSLKAHDPAIVVVTPKASPTAQANTGAALCARLPRCRPVANAGAAALGETVADVIKAELSVQPQ